MTRFIHVIATSLVFLNPFNFFSTPDQPLNFTENKGQVCDQFFQSRPDVLFYGNSNNLVFHIKNDGLSYQLWRNDGEAIPGTSSKILNDTDPERQSLYRVDVAWLGAKPATTIETDKGLPGESQFYLQQCANGVTGVRSYEGLTLKNIYQGVDVHYYGKQGLLKCDYKVAPYASYQQIRLKISGAAITLKANGEVNLKTPFGEIEEGSPVVYQNGKLLPARWVVTGDVLSFDIKDYDPSQELLIDPITRIWGTYYGGADVDGASGCTTDAAGNVYLSGDSQSLASGIIASSGAHQAAFAGIQDAYLAKFNAFGTRIWSTYYGGTGTEYGTSCCTDASGRVYLAGYTTSQGGVAIATPGSHQPLYGGNPDAFLVQFNSNGIRQWGTYYGGNYNDYATACATDAAGNVYLAGYTATNGGTAIATASSHQQTHGGGVGDYDGFLVKFNSSGTRLWATYYGGQSLEYANSCTTDGSGNVFLCGYTRSAPAGGPDIASIGAYQVSFGGGTDAFIAKFNTSGVRQWGTYYGGSGDDAANNCSTDAAGNVYLAGNTDTGTGTVIATTGAYQPVFGGNTDAFLVKFNPGGQRQWGTYYGGADMDIGAAASVDATGSVYLGGHTNNGLPALFTTSNGFQFASGGGYDAFLVQFDGSGQRTWATLYGGAGNDYGYSCMAVNSNVIYMAGTTSSNNGGAMVTQNSHQPVLGGLTDGFLTRFGCAVSNPTISANNPACIGSPINFTTFVTTTVTLSYNWYGPNSYTAIVQNPVIPVAQQSDAGTYTVMIDAGTACAQNATTTILVDPCTGLAEEGLQLNNIRVYPNPNNGLVYLELNQAAQISIYSAAGQLVYSTGGIEGKQTLGLGWLTPGLYVLRVENEQGMSSCRLIKQ